MKLKDKVALITGSATGIGRSTALLFSQEGAKVVLADISKEAEETVREIRAAGGSAVFVQGDVSVPSDAQKMVNTAKESYGEINILHNNAGILRICGDLFKTEESDWDRIVDINLKGVFLVSKYAIPLMISSGGGSIVNTASMAGWTVGMAGLAAYCASKAGVVGLTKCMALELAMHDIRANCVCPGTIDTTLYPTQFLKHGGTQDELDAGQEALAATIPQGRYGTSAEIAQAVLFLASEASSYVNGQALVVDGGFSNQ
jgi:NAD(P)-dependent dehydrogenase (short-subunit alcohol dehydrogenase family)